MKPRKTLEKSLAGSKNIRFDDIAALARALGFELARVSGSHHIFVHPDVPVPLNIQEIGGKAKPYQVRQLLRLIEEHDLTLGDDE
jgi:predicted RNA binding protein YcfA (HicA-like mRNA interferase family)